MKSTYFTSWSPSRLEKWERCPAFAKWEILDKLCTFCFKGQFRGKWGETQTCDKCVKVQVESEAIKRGNDIGDRLDKYLAGGKVIPVEIKNTLALSWVKKVKNGMIAGKAFIQQWLKLDHKWGPLPADDWGAWFNGRLDAAVREYGWKIFTIIDWKTGGVDRAGKVRSDGPTKQKYDDQINSYQVSVLSYYPEVQVARGALVFLDAAPGENPLVERPVLERADLAKAQQAWTKRLLPFFADRTFAPRANSKCPYCPFSKAKGGPCPY